MSVALYLKDPRTLDAVADHLRQTYNRHGEFLIFSNRAIRERVFEIFGQTFRITGVLRGIAVCVAVIGIFLTLTTLVTEREREIGVLRALGASRGQIQEHRSCGKRDDRGARQRLGNGCGTGAFAGADLCHQQSILWLDDSTGLPMGVTVWLTPVWIVFASLLAGWLPSKQASRVPISTAIRAE